MSKKEKKVKVVSTNTYEVLLRNTAAAAITGAQTHLQVKAHFFKIEDGCFIFRMNEKKQKDKNDRWVDVAAFDKDAISGVRKVA